MIIENWALWLARSFALSRYNHRAGIITLKAILVVFKMAAKLVHVSESEIDQFIKKMLFLKNQKMLQNLESSCSKIGW